jgi:hypothetical protein
MFVLAVIEDKIKTVPEQFDCDPTQVEVYAKYRLYVIEYIKS